jgi:hypothetical protein
MLIPNFFLRIEKAGGKLKEIQTLHKFHPKI